MYDYEEPIVYDPLNHTKEASINSRYVHLLALTHTFDRLSNDMKSHRWNAVAILSWRLCIIQTRPEEIWCAWDDLFGELLRANNSFTHKSYWWLQQVRRASTMRGVASAFCCVGFHHNVSYFFGLTSRCRLHAHIQLCELDKDRLVCGYVSESIGAAQVWYMRKDVLATCIWTSCWSKKPSIKA